MTRIRRPATYADLAQRLELARREREARRARWRERLQRLRGALPSRPITPLEETR